MTSPASLSSAIIGSVSDQRSVVARQISDQPARRNAQDRRVGERRKPNRRGRQSPLLAAIRRLGSKCCQWPSASQENGILKIAQRHVNNVWRSLHLAVDK